MTVNACPGVCDQSAASIKARSTCRSSRSDQQCVVRQAHRQSPTPPRSGETVPRSGRPGDSLRPRRHWVVTVAHGAVIATSPDGRRPWSRLARLPASFDVSPACPDRTARKRSNRHVLRWSEPVPRERSRHHAQGRAAHRRRFRPVPVRRRRRTDRALHRTGARGRDHRLPARLPGPAGQGLSARHARRPGPRRAAARVRRIPAGQLPGQADQRQGPGQAGPGRRGRRPAAGRRGSARPPTASTCCTPSAATTPTPPPPTWPAT